MNLKNPETQRLAHAVAKLTGESLTAAITQALRERLERLQNKQGMRLADRLVAIGQDCAVHLREPFRSMEHGDMLYDERGLPR